MIDLLEYLVLQIRGLVQAHTKLFTNIHKQIKTRWLELVISVFGVLSMLYQVVMRHNTGLTFDVNPTCKLCISRKIQLNI